nr:TolC family protein [candidate division Zixibacteria bacterium]
MGSLYRKTLLVISIIMLISGSALAEILTLDDCIELALKKNQDVIRARNMVKSADGNVWNAFGSFLPSISASASAQQTRSDRYIVTDSGHAIYIPSEHENDTLVIPPDTLLLMPYQSEVEMGGVSKSYSLGASASLTVFNGGQNIFNYLGSRSDKEYYKYQAEASEQNLIYNVKAYYFNYLKALDSRKINDEAVKRGEEQLKLAQSRFDVGAASKSDVLKAKVQYGNDKLALISAENDVKIAHANLTYLIGLNVNTDVDFATDYESREYNNSELDALKFGMANYPGLNASKSNLTSAKYAVWSAYGRYLPTLSVSVGRSWSNSRFSEVTKFRSEDAHWTIQTSLSVPIFSNFSRKRDVTSAKASFNNARADYFYAENSVALNIKEAYLIINKAKEALKVAGENVAAAEEDMSLVQEKYNLGAATILELMDAQVSLITAQNSKVEAEFDYNLAVARLENAMGIK